MRIVQLANFWTPTSGGLRVVMEHLARGYAARGHRVLQIVPGGRDEQVLTSWGRRTTVASPGLPGAGGYRMIVRLRHVERLVEAFGADVVEVSDRSTLAHLAGRWTERERRVVLVAHERLDHILGAGAYGGALDNALVRRIGDGWNPRCWRAVDDVVAPSRYGADEWHRIGIRPRIVPWGVDARQFRPVATPDPDVLQLAWVGRLSAEKRPGLAVEAVRVLHDLGLPVRSTVVGDGPLYEDLRDRAAGLPVDFVGHVADPDELVAVLGSATATLSTSGIETFGLAVLESLACGTPVVACEGGAAGEVAGPAGRCVTGEAASIAAGVLALWHDHDRRLVARARAEAFGWNRTVDAMLEVLAGRSVAA